MNFADAAAAAVLESKIRLTGLLTGVGSGIRVVQFQQDGGQPVLASRASSED
jgi:hypothetical protein